MSNPSGGPVNVNRAWEFQEPFSEARVDDLSTLCSLAWNQVLQIREFQKPDVLVSPERTDQSKPRAFNRPTANCSRTLQAICGADYILTTSHELRQRGAVQELDVQNLQTWQLQTLVSSVARTGRLRSSRTSSPDHWRYRCLLFMCPSSLLVLFPSILLASATHYQARKPSWHTVLVQYE